MCSNWNKMIFETKTFQNNFKQIRFIGLMKYLGDLSYATVQFIENDYWPSDVYNILIY